MAQDKIERVGRFYTHRFLWNASQHLQELASESDTNRRYLSYTSLLTLFFTLEAYINFLGEAAYPSIWANEQEEFKSEPYRGTLGKLLWLAEKLDVPRLRDNSRRPIQTFIVMQKVRRLLAHGKLEVVRAMETHDISSLDWIRDFVPTRLERHIRSGFEERASEDVQEAIELLHNAALQLFPRNHELCLTPHPLRGTERMETSGTI